MARIKMEDMAGIIQAKKLGPGNPLIENLETDSRRIRYSTAGLFIAIRGARHDGHKFITDLYHNGFRNFLVDEAFLPPGNMTEANFLVAKDTMQALHQLAAHHRQHLTLPFLAITGSNGKTMTKEWLFQCLTPGKRISRSPKSYNSQLGVPLSLWITDAAADLAIIEAGISMPGEMQKLEEIICPDEGMITNIGQAHQENFLSLHHKVKEKLRLFQHCQTIYYCLDHDLINQQITHSETLSPKKLVTWSRKNSQASLYLENIEIKDGKSHLQLIHGSMRFALIIPFSDDASVENCLHIANYLLEKGYIPESINEMLASLNPVEMRLEQIKGQNNNTLINDSYNSDINSLRIALDFQAIQQQHQERVIILSDLQQTGIPSDKLYRQVADLLNNYPIAHFIGVGDKIGLLKDISGSTFYSDTEALLKALPQHSFRNCSILIKGARKFSFERIVSALAAKQHTTVLEINLNSLVDNLNYFRSLLKPPTRIMVMVKALSYGSGTYEIANVLQHEKVDYLGVAFADEGALLRESGISLPIMVMSPGRESYEQVIDYRLEPEIYSFSGLEQFSKLVRRHQLEDYPVHIKIDSGMHRLGFLPEEIPALKEKLRDCDNLYIRSIFTHMAAADNSLEDEFTKMQLSRYNEVYTSICESLTYLPMRHALNSAGIERFPQAHYDMVRLGIGLHGISVTRSKLKAVSTLKTMITQIKQVKAGETIGYNRREKLLNDALIAIVPIGYADGLDRKLGNRNAQFIVRDIKVPVIGDVCMDMCMLDVTGTKAEEGDEVIVFGQQNSIRDFAEKIETIPYEILTNISERVKRVYINE